MIDRLVEIRGRNGMGRWLSDREIELLVASRPDTLEALTALIPSLAGEGISLLPDLLAVLGGEGASADADDSIASVSLF